MRNTFTLPAPNDYREGMSDAISAASADQETLKHFDLRDPPAGFVDDPYPWYRLLRTHAPVLRLPDDSVLITTHRHATEIYEDLTFRSDKTSLFGPKFGTSPLFEHHTSSLVFNDGAYHERVRATLVAALKPKAIEPAVRRLEARVDHLLANLRAAGRADFIDAFAARIPVSVICDLLGVPDADREQLRAWSLAILGALEPETGVDDLNRGNRAVEEFKHYLSDLIRARRMGTDDPSGRVLDALIDEHRRKRLSTKELLHNCIFLLNAGHETTTNLIGNGMQLLLDNPATALGLAENPRAVRLAIEEMLRYESPNQLGNRELTRRAVVGDVTLQPGTQIVLCIGAANRDETVFDDAERFIANRSPNPHLAFATGPHMCAGMALARIEARVAFTAILQHIGHLKPAGPAVRQRRLRFRGLAELPIEYES